MSNELKSTPGPWNIETNVNHYPFICDNDGNLISMLIDAKDGSLFYGKTLEETEANANIIAAVPDMVEALTAVDSDPAWFALSRSTRDLVKSAFAKAIPQHQITERKLTAGEKVTYAPEFGKWQNGMVKSVRGDIAFVVFQCNNEWGDFEQYTGQSTKISDLKLGWGHF